jgi:hypothetical protein
MKDHDDRKVTPAERSAIQLRRTQIQSQRVEGQASTLFELKKELDSLKEGTSKCLTKS